MAAAWPPYLTDRPLKRRYSRTDVSYALQGDYKVRNLVGMSVSPNSWLISAQALASAFNATISMALLVALARSLSAAQFGGYVATLSLAVVLLVLLEGGWPQRVYRESTLGTAEESAALAANALGHVLLAGLLLVLLGLALPLDLPGLGAAMLCMGCVAAMNLVSARMRAAGRFGLEAAWQVGGRATSALTMLGALWAGLTDPATLFLAWAAGLALVLLLAGWRWLSLPRLRGWRLGFSLTLPFLLVEALGAMLMKGDVAVLRGWGADPQALAFYAACTRLNEAALLLFAPVGNVLLRGLRLAHADRAAFTALWRTWMLCGAGLGLAAVAGSWLLGGWLMGLLFGEAYAAAGELLGFTALMLPFALGNLVLVVALLARGDERWLVTRLAPAAGLMVLGMGLGWSLLAGRGAALAVALAHALVWGWALRRLLSGEGPPSSPSAAPVGQGSERVHH